VGVDRHRCFLLCHLFSFALPPVLHAYVKLAAMGPGTAGRHDVHQCILELLLLPFTQFVSRIFNRLALLRDRSRLILGFAAP